MTHTTPEVTKSGLTPAQSADVIRYYDASENEAFHANNWRVRKVKLGQVAIHTTRPEDSVLPDGAPMLTMKEASEGHEYLLKERDATPRQAPEARPESWPIEPTDDQLVQIEDLADKIPCSYTEAYAKVMGIWPN
jgi:hypothetical protein